MLIGALLPEELLTLVFHKLSGIFPQGVPTSEVSQKRPETDLKQAWSSRIFADVGHFVLFTGLGFFAGLNGRKFGFVFLAGATITFALISEVLQLLVVSRTPSIADLLIDASGVLLGLALGCVFYLFCRSSAQVSGAGQENVR